MEKKEVVDKENYLEFLGDEWGKKEDVLAILSEFVKPYVTPQSHALEIGVGGGRIAHQVAPLVGTLDVTDISSEMIARSKQALASHGNINYFTLASASLGQWKNNSIDFVYSFDVFVHLDVHTMWGYFQEINRILKPNGKAFLHTSNLLAPEGWRRFSSQSKFRIEGHYFITPEIIHTFCNRSKLSLIKESLIDETNFYYARDYLLVIEKS